MVVVVVVVMVYFDTFGWVTGRASTTQPVNSFVSTIAKSSVQFIRHTSLIQMILCIPITLETKIICICLELILVMDSSV